MTNNTTISEYVQKLIEKGYSARDIEERIENVATFMLWAYEKDYVPYQKYQQIKDGIATFRSSLAPETVKPLQSHSQKALNTIPASESPLMSLRSRISSLFNRNRDQNVHITQQPSLTTHTYGPTSPWPAQRIEPPIQKVSVERASGSGLKPPAYIGIVIAMLVLSVLGASIYEKFIKTPQSSLAYPATPTFTSTRTLSFQGRLTDSLGNPIVASTNMRFRVYTASSGGTTLYDSGTCAITPDSDGIHNVLIGQTCGAGIGSGIFTENAEVWLGATVGTDAEMTPRQQIANVPYALNTETLQGLPPGSSTSNIPVINSAGDLLIATAGPQIASTFASETFIVSSAQAVTLQSAGSGDVTLTATESGTIKFATGGSQHGLITNTGLFGFGTTGPDAKLDVLRTSGEQLRLTYTDGAVYTGFTTNSSGDLSIATTGGDYAFTDTSNTLFQIKDQGVYPFINLAGKTDTGDPGTCAEGDMYYNDTDDTIKICHETNTWEALDGSGATQWTDSGTTVYLTDTTDALVIGGSSPLSSAKFSIDGDADQPQMLVQGNATQTTNLAIFEQSDGTDILTISNAGDLVLSGNTTLGNASGDTVTANAAAWTFANDTTVNLSGGVNGLNIDTNTLSIDATNNRIGLGTAAPDGKLQVTGASIGKALVILDETGDQDILVASSSGTTRFRVANDGTVYGGYFLDMSNTAYGIDPAGTSNFGGYSLKITGGALLAADSGNVGIGDLTPDAKLNILATTEQLRLDYDDSNYTSFTVGSGGDLTIAPTGSDTNVTGNLAISGGTTLGDASGDTVTANAAAWTFANDTTVALTGGVNGINFDSNTLSIDGTNDRVGIGTAAPTNKLHIAESVGSALADYETKTVMLNSGTITTAGGLSSVFNGARNNAIVSMSSGTQPNAYAVFNYAQGTGTGTTTNLIANYNQVKIDSGATATNTYNNYNVNNYEYGGTTTNAYGNYAGLSFFGGGTVTNRYGFYAANPNLIGGGGTNTVTNNYGFYVAAQTYGSTSDVGLYIADADTYSLQLASTDGDAASGITFGTDTNLYRNGANSLHTDDALDIDGAFTTDGDVAVNGDDITSDSNLTINATGYVRIGDTASPGSANGDDDLFVEGDLEIDGVMYLDGTLDTSFTAGSVVFAGTSGVLAQDNSSFFFDDSSNELGLGDTTPDAFLDITGTSEQLRLSYETGDTNYASFTLSSGGDLTIAPTGSDTNVTGNLAVSGNTGLGDADADTTTITGKEILNFDATSLGNGDHNALYINASRSTSTASTLRGLNLSANYSATSGTQTGMNGLDFTVQASGNGGTVTTMKGISAWGVVGTGATVGTFKLVDVANPSNSGTITSLSGYSVDNLTSGTNNTLILAGTTSIPSGNWGIYNSSSYSNYFAGITGIGTTGADAKLDVLSTTEQLRLTYTDGSAYSAFTVSSGGDLTLDPTGGNIVADANFNPNTHDTYDLGTDAARWKDLYLGPDTLHVGTSTTDEGTLKYVTSTNVLTLTNNFGDTDFGSTSDGFNFTLGGGAGDDLIVDATTLVVESDNDRVGIGTAAPDAAWLDIAAATTGKAQINLTTSAATDVSAPASGDLWWNGTNLYFYNGAINKDLLAAGSTGPWTDGGSYVYTTAGEVLNLGGITGAAYHAISDSGTTSHSLATDDDLYVEGDFEVDTAFFTDGSTTIGDASGDTVTANAAAWTFANDTTVALTGGVDGINFDSNTLSIDGTNDRVGFGTAAPSAKTHVLATTEQMRLGYDVSNYASFTTSSGGDLTVDATGGQFLLADADTINIGGVSALAYNAIADSGGATSHGLASDDDLFVEGDTEVNGVLYADGETVLTTVSGAGLSDCDSATSILLWDSTSKQFSCGKDNNTIVLATWTEVNVVASLTDAQMDRPQPAYLSGATSEIYVPYAGNIVGISIAGSAVRTAGSATFTVFKNDGTTGFTCVIDGTNTQYNDCTQASGTDTFAAGDFLDVRITTDLGFAPSAANEYAVEIWVEMDTGADVAELYNVKDMSIRSADIVSIDPTLTDGVMKSTGSYDTALMGVIATKPGVLLGTHDVPDLGASRAVALTGRVPVKVTTENGPIKVGDAITSSTIPGVGMRSTRAARVVGRALSGWDNPDPSVVGTVMLFVEPAYDAGYLLTEMKQLILDAQKILVTDSLKAGAIITDTFTSSKATITHLISTTFTADTATITDAEIKNLNAQALKTQTLEAEKIKAEEIETASLTSDTLESTSITAGTIVADEIDTKNVRELKARLEELALNRSSSTIDAKELHNQVQDIQEYITQLTDEQTPEGLADTQTYQEASSDVTLDPGTTTTALGETVSIANLDSLTVTGSTQLTQLVVADAFSAGNIFIKDNSLLSMSSDLKLSALERVDIMNGGVIITADGTLTSKGEVIAEKGLRSNTLRPIKDGEDVAVILNSQASSDQPADSQFAIQNTGGTRVASIDAKGGATFTDLALTKYTDATSSAVVISARDNYRQSGLYAPAIKTGGATSGNGILPHSENNILIFSNRITAESIVNLTATSTSQNKSLFVDFVETCVNSENQLCQPYFRVALDEEIDTDVTFNWLIVN